jgi:hypothetical protein
VVLGHAPSVDDGEGVRMCAEERLRDGASVRHAPTDEIHVLDVGAGDDADLAAARRRRRHGRVGPGRIERHELAACLLLLLVHGCVSPF